jgi:hypothetical protein
MENFHFRNLYLVVAALRTIDHSQSAKCAVPIHGKSARHSSDGW